MGSSALSVVIEALHRRGIASRLLKGTALAYSIYPDPAIRRRGDTDILISRKRRNEVREILKSHGFVHAEENMTRQETWEQRTDYGFSHVLDLHWDIKASPAVSAALSRAIPSEDGRDLTAISEQAKGLGPLDNLILISVNRRSHQTFGFINGEDQVHDLDRLIWAVDVDLLAGTLDDAEWLQLATLALRSGCASLVADTLRFAQDAVGTHVPPKVLQALEACGAREPVTEYYSGLGTFDRIGRDLSASPSLGGKIEVLYAHIFPSPEVLHRRYPQARNWPRPLLYLRRLLSGLGKLVAGQA